jgi:acyl carrier protein
MSDAKNEVIRQFIVNKLVKKADQKNIADSDNIIMSGVIDSLGIMHLITFLEDKFKIKVKDDEILPENFESIESISNYLNSQGIV